MNKILTNLALFITGILSGYVMFLLVLITLALMIIFFPFILLSFFISNWD